MACINDSSLFCIRARALCCNKCLQAKCREGKCRAACIAAYASGAFSAGGTDHDRLTALRALAGLWLTETGKDLAAALRGWALVATIVDMRTISTPLMEVTVETLQSLLGVCLQLKLMIAWEPHVCRRT
jgi:hypothetical protein